MDNRKAVEIFMTCKIIALAGVSDDKEKWGYKLFKLIPEHGFKVYGVNPKLEKVEGEKIYSSLEELPEKPCGVVFVLNPHAGMKIAESMVKLGIDKAWLQPGAENDKLIVYLESNNITTVHNYCIKVHLSRGQAA